MTRHPWIVWAFWILLVAASPLRAADDTKSLMGCWQNDKDEKDMIRFEPMKCTNLDDGKQEFYRARYEPGRVLLSSPGGDGTIEYSLKGGRLLLKGEGDEPDTYHKLDRVPPELVLKSLALGAKKPLPPERIEAIRDALARRQEKDQAVRTDPERAGQMGEVDADNTAYLSTLIKEIGWIDAKRFDRDSTLAAFLIVQHSGDLQLMAAALPEIEKDLKAGTGDPQDFALLYDRLKLKLGERQRYGSQIGADAEGNPVVLPLDDRKKVEEFRKGIGLFPLAQYLEIYQQLCGKPVKFMDDGK